MTLDHLLPILLIEIAVIVGVSRAFGYLFARFHQPQVVGEMVAGIALGPSVLGALSDYLVHAGWVSAAAHPAKALFPPETVIFLGVLAQLGVILFLFLVGLELDPKLLRNKGHAAVVISHASIVAPFLLGAALTLYLYPRLFSATPAMAFTPVALFMGAAMSITAFPVLARILTERNLHKTKIGAVAITCAAVDDVTAWCMLAFVVGVARAEGMGPALLTAGLSVVYVLGMFFVVRPFLARLQAVYDRQGRLNLTAMALVLGLVLLSAWTTEKIGIHALFGAFMVGAMMPKGTDLIRTVTDRLEDVVVVLLLPIFFAFTGLKTQIGLLNTPELWGYTGLIVLVACAGKFGGSAIAGRACGMPWREASVVGTLMNTRGLMELVILNIGLSLGVIPPAVFAMMVIMALVTTAATAPVLHYLYPLRYYAAEVGAAVGAAAGRRRRKAGGATSVLIPVADPRSGGPLLQLADLLTAPPPAAAAGALAAAGGTPPEAAGGRAAQPGPPASPAITPAAGTRKIYALHLRRPVEKDAYLAVTDEVAAGAAGHAHAPAAPAAARPAARLPRARPAAEASLQPLLERADAAEIPVETIAFVSRDVASDIVRTAADRDVDLVLMGSHRAVVGRTVLGGAVHRVLTEATTDVAVFLDRGLTGIRRVLVPFLGSPHDRLALEMASRLGRSAGARVTVLHVVPADRADRDATGASDAVRAVFADPTQPAPVEFRVVRGEEPIDAVLGEAGGFDLMIVGVGEEWGLESHRFGLRPERLVAESACSLLLVRKGEAGGGVAGEGGDKGSGVFAAPPPAGHAAAEPAAQPVATP
jgi:Kef-type K+ transport system membrane component KefB/nucleotide-binding universal stress UspA family protein